MKRVFSLLLLLSISVLVFAQGVSEQDVKTRVIVDAVGREVEIPESVETICTLGSGAPRICAYLDAMDMLVGVEKHDSQGVNILRDYSPVYYESYKDLPIVGNGGGSGGNNGFAEELIVADPDVILAGFDKEAADELQKQTGIPVVSVRYLSRGFFHESFYDAMNVFASVVGKEDRSQEVLSFIDECIRDLDERTKDVPEDKKLKAYAGAVTFSGRHGFTGTYSNFGPLDAVNAINVADVDANTNYYEADFEKILEWDPDVIFLDPGNMNLVNDEIKKKPDYFASVRAIEEGNVYTMPSFNNCGTNISYALLDAYYAGKVLFPEQFADVEISEIGKKIFETMLGEDIYQEMSEAGLYYGEIEIDL